MTEKEVQYLDGLTRLSDEDLINWIRGLYIGNQVAMDPPFAFEEPFEVAERTFFLAHKPSSDSSYHPIIDRLEKIFVLVFGYELESRPIAPALIIQFVYIFKNQTPSGSQRRVLSDHLFHAINSKEIYNIWDNNRNLYYELVDLLLTLNRVPNTDTLSDSFINDFIDSSLFLEKSSRFCNLALDYYSSTSNAERFFNTLTASVRVLPDEKMYSLADAIVLFHRKSRILSFGHLANWLASLQLEEDVKSKLNQFYKNDRLFKLLLETFSSDYTGFMKVNRKEGRFIIAILVLITARYNSSRLSPFLVKLFFENERFEGAQERILLLLQKLTNDNMQQVRRIININWSVPDYSVIHIATLVALNELSVGSMDNWDYNWDKTGEEESCFLTFEKSSEMFVVENFNYEGLIEIFQEEKFAEKSVEIGGAKIKGTFMWWQMLDSCMTKLNAVS